MKMFLSSLLLLPMAAHGAAWAPSSLVPHQPHHHLAFAPSPQKQQQSFVLHMTASGSSNATSSSNSDDSTKTSTTPATGDVDPIAFQADLDKGLEELTNLVEDCNAPPATAAKGFGTPPKGFGKQKAATPSKKKTDDQQKFVDNASQALDDLNRINQAKQAPPTKSPHQLIREAKQAKAQKIQKITAEETPKPKKEVFNPVSQPWLKKDQKEEPKAAATPKTYFPPTPIANKPKVPVKPNQQEKETPSVTSSAPQQQQKPKVVQPKSPEKETPVAQQQQKTYFPPTPMANKPKVPVKKEENTEPRTPIVGKTTNPFVQPPKKKTPVVEEQKKEQAKMKSLSDTVGGSSGVETTQKQKKKGSPPQLPKIPKMDLPKVELPKVELPKMDFKKVELPKVDLKKLELPKVQVSKDTVDQAMDFTQKTSSILVNSAQVIVKGGMDFWVEVQSSMNTTRVDDLDMTYEEAFGKVAQSGRGFLKICSILGTAVKDTFGFFADEIKQQRKTSSTKKKKILSPAADLEDDDEVVVGDWTKTSTPKPKSEFASSYLDQLESKTLGRFMEKEEEKAQLKKKADRPRLNVRDIRVPTIPIFKAPEKKTKTTTTPEATKMEVANVADAEDVVSDDTSKASAVKKIEIPNFKTSAAVEELEQIQSKAGSMLGDLWSSASKAMKEAQTKAREEAEKLQAKAGEFKLPEKKDKTPKMSKTQAVVDPNKKNKKKGGPAAFFLDLDDK